MERHTMQIIQILIYQFHFGLWVSYQIKSSWSSSFIGDPFPLIVSNLISTISNSRIFFQNVHQNIICTPLFTSLCYAPKVTIVWIDLVQTILVSITFSVTFTYFTHALFYTQICVRLNALNMVVLEGLPQKSKVFTSITNTLPVWCLAYYINFRRAS